MSGTANHLAGSVTLMGGYTHASGRQPAIGNDSIVPTGGLTADHLTDVEAHLQYIDRCNGTASSGVGKSLSSHEAAQLRPTHAATLSPPPAVRPLHPRGRVVLATQQARVVNDDLDVTVPAPRAAAVRRLARPGRVQGKSVPGLARCNLCQVAGLESAVEDRVNLRALDVSGARGDRQRVQALFMQMASEVWWPGYL